LMLQQDEPDDFVIGTGVTHSVGEFCERAFAEVDLDYRDYIREDERFLRPAEVDLLLADATKAKRVLDWQPIFSFDQMIGEMVHSDIESLQARKLSSAAAGYQII